MRIAVDARPLAFPMSGIGRYTLSLLREFANQEIPHQLFLYCDRPFELPFPLPDHWKIRTGTISTRALSTPFAQTAFPIWARKDRIDVFWSPRHHLPLLLPRKIRKVLTIHDAVWKRFPQTMTRGGHLMESLLMPASVKLADSIIAVSNFTKREIIELFGTAPEKIHVIYEASSLQGALAKKESAAKPAPCEPPYFLFVGSSEPRKNLERLLTAYMHYRQAAGAHETANPPLRLVIVGSYQWGTFDAVQFIERHQLTHCVQLINHIDDNTLCGIYANATALVIPSFYEGFGLPLVEAMQWGIPLIIGDKYSGDDKSGGHNRSAAHDKTDSRGAMAEIAGDAGLPVDPLSIDEITTALLRISQDRALHHQLSANSKARGAEFDWQRAAGQTLTLLTDRNQCL